MQGIKINLQDLRKRIQSRTPHLTKTQKIIANYIVENPKKFALCSIRELEEELGTSKSTIVRLAQSLGYDGFAELKTAFLKTMRDELGPIPRYKARLKIPENGSNYLNMFARETIENIHATLELIDSNQFNELIKVVEHARQVHTMGLGISYYLAEMTAYLLNRVSIKATPMITGGLSFSEQIVNFRENDLIIAFSFPPYSEKTVQAAAYAKEKGLRVISFTDKAATPIVYHSDLICHVKVDSVGVSNSVMSVLVVIYAMVSNIGRDLKTKTLKTLESIDHVRKEHAGVD